MARQRRLRIANHPFHIVHRGVDREACFRREADYGIYLGLLRELAEESRCQVHAYVLMTNHVHLLVTPSEPGACSALMKRLAQSHAQYCNRTWKRTGPLWEGRFKDSLVDSAGYGLACQRYIELNPVRAGMVRHPGAYPWSSYRSNAMGEPQPMLSLLPAFRALAEDDDSRRRLYRQMFDEPESADLLDEIRAALRKETPLGTESFLDEMEAVSGRRFRRRAGMRGRQGLSPKGL